MYADENVIKIKHDVLYQVAKLAFEGKLQEKKEANDKKIQELKAAAAASGKAAKPGSLADKVGMVSRYNEINDKRK